MYSGEFCICDRCGQVIKNICDWDGKQYGADCWEVVSGYRANQWAGSEEKTRKAIAQQIECDEYNRELRIRIDTNRTANEKYLAALLTCAEETGNNFARDMYASLCQVALGELSPRQQTAVLKIYKRYAHD